MMKQHNVQFDKTLKALQEIIDAKLSPLDRIDKLLLIADRLSSEKLYNLAELCFNEIKKTKDIEPAKSIEIDHILTRFYFNTNRLSEAENLLLEIYNKCGETGNDDLKTDICLSLAGLYYKIGELEQSKFYLENSIEQSLSKKDNIAASRLLNLFARMTVETGDINKGKSLLDKAHTLIDYTKDQETRLDYEIELANAQIECGLYKQAENIAKNILRSTGSSNYNKFYIHSTCFLIRIFIRTGKFIEAYNLALKTRNSLSFVNNHSLFIDLEYLYWICCWHIGDYSIAISELKRIYKLQVNNIERFTARKLILTIFRYLIFTGQLNRAKSYLDELEKYTDTSSYYRMQYNYLYGILNLHNGDIDSAYDYLNRALEIAKKQSVVPFLHRIELTISEVHLQESDHEKALRILNRLKPDVIKTSDHFNSGKLYYLLTTVYLNENQIDRAKSSIKEALKCNHTELRAHILHKAYQVYKASGDNRTAGEYCDELIKNLKSQINSFKNNEDKEKFTLSHNRKEILLEVLKQEEKSLSADKPSISIEKFDFVKKINLCDDDAYISTLDGEKMFGISRITIFRWIKDGKIKAFKSKNGRYRFLLSALKDYIATQKTGKGTSLPTIKRYLQQEEKRYLRTLLESGKKRKEIASILEITEQYLSKKIKDYNIKA